MRCHRFWSSSVVVYCRPVWTPMRTSGGYRARRAPERASAPAGSGGPPTVVDVLDIDTWPVLRSPVLVLVLIGWVDAGGAGASAAEALAEQLGAARVFARYD